MEVLSRKSRTTNLCQIFLKFEHTSEIYRHDMPNFMTEICESRLLFGCFQDALFRNLNQAPPRRGEHMSTYLLAG